MASTSEPAGSLGSTMPSSTVVWSDQHAFLFHGMRQLLDTGDGSDFQIKCHERVFKVHKLILNLFTDYFRETDGIWLRIQMDPVILEKILVFLYHGQVNVQYDEMETFLENCRALNIRLFKDDSIVEDPSVLLVADENYFQERYELNDFQLMCRACYKVFPDDKALKKHTWACTRKANFACRFCEKTFKHRPTLVDHERFHLGEKPFKCPEPDCAKAFTLKSAMTNHYNEKHKGMTYACDECGLVKKSKMSLRYHVYTKHAKTLPFACNECGQCFALKSILTHHIQLKHPKGEGKPGKSRFSHMPILDASERRYVGKKKPQSMGFWKLHIGPMKMKCFYCDNIFSRHHFTPHLKRIHPERPVNKEMLTELDNRLKAVVMQRRRAQNGDEAVDDKAPPAALIIDPSIASQPPPEPGPSTASVL